MRLVAGVVVGSEFLLIGGLLVGPHEVVGLANDGGNRESLAPEAHQELVGARATVGESRRVSSSRDSGERSALE
jgi:hypothetical protein